jgi:hypothetical protein
MCLDFVILVMTIAGLWFMVPSGRSGLWKMLFADGIAYFTLVASANAIPAVSTYTLEFIPSSTLSNALDLFRA